MKIKSLILALPILCLACDTPSDTSDPASHSDASPILAKRVTGVLTLTSNAIYDNPCTIVGEEFVRSTFGLDEKAEVAEVMEHDGCMFEWAGNKVTISFNGRKPYQSIFIADYDFSKMYQTKGGATETAIVEEAPKAEGTTSGISSTSNTTAPEAKAEEGQQAHPSPALTSAAEQHAKPVVSKGSYVPVQGIGDKAVWDPTTGAMHVLYETHIINVTVETKGKAEMRKEQAQSIAEVIIEKIADNEYIRRL